MDGWTDGRMDGWMDGWTDGWTEGRTDATDGETQSFTYTRDTGMYLNKRNANIHHKADL